MSDRVKSLVIFIAVGVVAGLVTYRLAALGKLPWKLTATGQNTSPQTVQTQVVVQEENAIIDSVSKASPSVVAIGVNQSMIDPFTSQTTPGQQGSNTIGTGFIVSADKGIIVTNRHVVADTSMKYTVVTKDGKKLDVQKIYRDPNLDLALVQVASTNGLQPLQIGDSSKLKSGQTVIAIGNALGRFDNTVTTGVVSGLGRSVSAGDPYSNDSEELDNLIQTDAAINPGNSGGPLLNSSGQVIGVDVATTEGAQNIGFAIPINSVKTIVDQFVTNGFVSRPFLGVRYSFVSKDVALLNNVPQGAYIEEVVSGSPAEKAGIQAGDIITKIDGQTVDSDTKISDTIGAKKVGNTVTLEIWSESQGANSGQTTTATVTLVEAPDQ